VSQVVDPYWIGDTASRIRAAGNNFGRRSDSNLLNPDKFDGNHSDDAIHDDDYVDNLSSSYQRYQ
jgi:hypothetical protein